MNHHREQLEAHELAQAPLEPVSMDSRMLMPRHDDADPRELERGSGGSDVQMHGPNALPLANDGLEIEAPRQAMTTRKSKLAASR